MKYIFIVIFLISQTTFASIKIYGPTKIKLDKTCSLNLPKGYFFINKEGIEKLRPEQKASRKAASELLGMIGHEKKDWYIILENYTIGFIPLESSISFNQQAIIDSLKKNTSQNNQTSEVSIRILGWQQPVTLNRTESIITWAIRGVEDGVETINHDIKYLTRHGFINATIFTLKKKYQKDLEQASNLLEGFKINQGYAYNDYMKGDIVNSNSLSDILSGKLKKQKSFLQNPWKGYVMLIALTIFLAYAYFYRRKNKID